MKCSGGVAVAGKVRIHAQCHTYVLVILPFVNVTYRIT